MGVDIQTYRARIGTNKAAFGVDVVTSVVQINLRHMFHLTALLVYLLVLIIVAFVDIQELRTNVESVITEETGNDVFAKSDVYENTVSHLHVIGAVCATILALHFESMKGAVRFIGLLLLMAGIESNPGPKEPWPNITLTDENLKHIAKAINVHWTKLASALCVEYDATTDIKRSTPIKGNHNTMILMKWNEMSSYNRTLLALIRKLQNLDGGSKIDWELLREKVNEIMTLRSGTNHVNLFHTLRLNDKVSVQIHFEDMYIIDADAICEEGFTKPHTYDRHVWTFKSPQWVKEKCETKENVEEFSCQLRQSIFTMVNCKKHSTKSVTFCPFSYGNCPAHLAMVEFTSALLELKRVGTGTLECIYVVSQDPKLAFDLQLCLESMLESGLPPGWFNYELFTDNETRQNKTSVKPTGRDKPDKNISGKEPARQIFELLHLTNRLDQKISIEEAITIYNSNSATDSLKESPWIILQKLMFVNWNEGEEIPNALQVAAERNSFLDEIDDREDDEIAEISVIDIFMAVFNCTDIILRPLLFQKMHLCKLAIPFVYKHYLKGSLQITRWLLQLLSVYNDDTHASNTHVMNMKTNVITFVRFGRPDFSKSLLLNRCLHERSNAFHTFFNKDCRSGFLKRHLYEETVEISWSPSEGSDSAAKTFLNVRGDFETIYLKSDREYPLKDLILKLTDVCVAIVDIEYFYLKSETLLKLITSFPCSILLLYDNLKFNNRKDVRTILRSLDEKLNMVISTHKKQSAIDVPTLIKNINTGILSLLQDFKKSTSIEKRLCSVCKDVSYPDCEEYCLQLEQGRMMAQDIFKSMLTDIQNTGGKSHSAKNEDRFRNCLTALTPVSHIHSNKLYKNYKDLRAVREYQNDSEETLKEMISTRYEQLNSMTKTTIMFAKYLVYTNKQPLLQHIFIQWLKILIDIEMSQFLPEMIRGQNEVYKRIMRLKNGPDTKEKEQLNKEFVDLEGDISASSLTVDHLLREVSHIYDSILYLNRRCEKYCIPETQDIIRSFTNLMLRTEAIDIVTEYFFMPKYWTNELFKALDTAIPNKDSITIVSVLGLQSTGKSTLLNTMFGQQFKVRGGRCTKGVQARLVSVSDGFDVLPSKYIMVFDSEGFRAPELKTVMNTYDRDNQLATFVSGLGNISIMTVNGENATELTDIIQIVVHASLRLKTANSSIVLGHKCFFVHNNVEEQSEEQMQKGYIEFRKLMDSVAIEAARSEGLGNISSFNDIMQFDERRPFKALPNIWNGDSKIRVFNSKYSKSVADIKSDISLLLENDKYESFRDIATFATDIWDGVITENFVFSFRNSLEMQLYCSTETEINETILKSQIKLQDEFNSRKRKGENDTNVKMLETKAELKESLELLTDSYCSEAKAFVSKLLHTCKYPHIVKQWESQYVKKVEFCYKEMKESIHQDVDRYFFDIQLTTETASIGKKYRDELKSTSMRIAQTMQGKNRNEYDKEFYKHWNTYENDVRKKRDEIFPPLNVCNHFRNLTMKKYSYDANLSKALSVFDRKTAIHSSTQFFVRKISKDDYNLSLTTLFGSQTEMIITHELQEYSKNVERILENLNQTKGPLYENDLQRVFEDIVSKCTDVNTKMKKQGVTLKTSFVTGLVVQTLQYASCMIDSHNETYDKDYGFSASLKRFQMEMYDLFESEITQRRLEEKAARQFCLGIENAVTDIIKDNLTIRASQLLLQELPNIKFNLIKAVSYSLLKAKRFSDFLQYIKLPRDFCCSWYKQECYKVLHSNGKYIELLQHEVENYRRGTERAIPKHVDSSVDVSTWFCNFAKHLTLFTCSKIHFRTFLEIDKLGDFNCFLSFLVDKGLLYETFQRIENNFRSIKDKQGTFTVLYESLFDKCWGCPEVCPFCHEPCMKSKDHGGKHQCLQHRPLGGKGSRWIKSNEIVLNTCNFLVNTMTRRYRCSLVSNKCGCKKTMTECNVYHPYRNYKEFFKNWDIMPSSDPHGCCKFWLWFVGKFAEDLKKHHEYKISEIPDSWFQISDAEALKSLDAYFTVI